MFSTKQEVLWSGKWVAWFLDDLSACMSLLLDFFGFKVGVQQLRLPKQQLLPRVC